MKGGRAMRGLELWAVGITALASLASLAWSDMRLSLGVMLGGFLMAANFWVIRHVVSDLMGQAGELEDSKRRKRRSWLVFQYVLKMVALLVILGAALKFGKVSPAGLLVGITAALTALLAAGLRAAAFDDEN